LIKIMNDQCKHDITELRYMSHCKQYRKQCLSCFQSVGDAIAKRNIELVIIDTIPLFDIESRDKYWKQRSNKYVNLAQKLKSEADLKLVERKEFYHTYLQSQQWRILRARVIEREIGVCQGCRAASITQVHHRNYDRLGNELLTDLYGYCETCHKKTHGLL